MITQLVVYKILFILFNYSLIAADLCKQKALDADSRAIQFNWQIKKIITFLLL